MDMTARPETAVERSVMRGIETRYARQAAAERKEARQAHAAAHQPAPSRTTWDSKPRPGDRPAQLGERERQRVEHLVLGRERPTPKSVGKGRAKRKIPITLKDEGVDQALQLREAYGHKRATPETLHHFHAQPEGALRRLFSSGGIDQDQLNSAEAIATIAEVIARDVDVRTASLEARVDVTRMGDGTFFEKLARVRAEVAYGYWRDQVVRLGPIGAVLDMVVGETIGFTVVAARYRMGKPRTRKLLLDALDLWPAALARARGEISSADLAAAHAGIL